MISFLRHILLLLLLTGAAVLCAQSVVKEQGAESAQRQGKESVETQEEQSTEEKRWERYGEEYIHQSDASSRLQLANEFFDFLLQTEYIDEPVVFPADAHMDSVDLNVYYYIAEWHYSNGDYASAAEWCSRATGCMGEVDDVSKSDVYSLLGAAYFRMSEFDKAAEALNESYQLDKLSGDYDRMSSTLNGIASVFTAAGKPDEAEKYIHEAIAANSLTDNLSRRAVLFGTASEICRSTGEMEQSLSYAQEALLIERQLGDSAKIGVRLSQVANAEIGSGRPSEAKRSLTEAMPLLLKSGNIHSWGICANQMSDILTEEGRYYEAADYYRQAAMRFLKQGDKYNEMHAREGLYSVTKNSNPQEAMLHLERAKQLQDSIYKQETGEAVGRYNAIYYNDILRMQQERDQQHRRFVIALILSIAIPLLMLIAIAVYILIRRHRSLQGRYSEISRLYRNTVAETIANRQQLTEDDRRFIEQLVNVIDKGLESGQFDLDAIAEQMHILPATIRRRLADTLSVTPKSYILQIRMQKARYLLNNYHDMTVSEVAERCGYTQMANFTRAFTRFYGFPPSEIIKNERVKE